MEFKLGNRWIGINRPTLFIADIASNHDGSLERAVKLIHLAADAGADAVKFQHFRAETIVSKKGFEERPKTGHQAAWSKPVYHVYQEASVPLSWTPTLKKECDKAGVIFMTTPYDIELVDALDPYVPAFKIGSGDIDWLEFIEYVASRGKPVFMATGAATFDDVLRAVETLEKSTNNIVLMQCNTNYTGSIDNFKHINLKVLTTYRHIYPNIILGLSDHTPGHLTVLGAVALGARVVEKHFTDDTTRCGPDHAFSMTPDTWKRMVYEVRLLEASLGDGIKKIEANEHETRIVQRRCLRAAYDIPACTVLSRVMIAIVRPANERAIPPDQLPKVLGRTAKRDIPKDAILTWEDIS